MMRRYKRSECHLGWRINRLRTTTWTQNQERNLASCLPLPVRVVAILIRRRSNSDRRRRSTAENLENLSRNRRPEGRQQGAASDNQNQQTINQRQVVNPTIIEPFYGDIPGDLPQTGEFRIHSVNVGNIGVEAGDPKNESLCTAIKTFGSDIVLLQELGNNWDAQPKKNNWKSRLEDKMDMAKVRTITSHNAHDPVKERSQYGGTGLITYGKLAYSPLGSGRDKSGLGRWTWARYRGKNGATLRCVSVYRPCSNNKGEESVGAQHTRYFKSINDDRLPRDAFLEDLDQDIAEWIESGDNIVVAGDVNESVFSDAITNLFEKHQMRNLIFERHSPADAPSTYRRNESNGIVDGMWGTPMVEVKKSGFLEAGDFPGDHAALWVDITFESVLGHDPPVPDVFSARRLQLIDSKATKKYLRTYEQLVARTGFAERVNALQSEVIPGQRLTMRQQKIAENLDAERTKYMNKAEKKCRKLRMGAIEFSAATSEPRKQFEFWSIAITRRKGGNVSARMWRRKKQSAGVTGSIRDMSDKQLQEKVNEAKQQYREAKKHAPAARLDFIETFAKKDRDRIKKREQSVKLGRIAKKISGKGADKSVTTVVDGNGHEHTTKEAIDAAIMPVNEAKYRASEDTPFMNELLSDFGYNGHSEAVDQVLAGTYTPPVAVSEGTNLLLKSMKFPEATNRSNFQVESMVTVEEHVKGWKKAREKTTAGPSGLHFGMFKANATVKNLALIDASLRNIAYTTGHIYQRWCNGVDVQILKKSKDYRIEKLRTILLLEADYNMNSKQLGRDIMWKAERDATLSRDNYGGRKKRRSVEVSLNTVLTYNSIWARRGRAVVLSNDAKGCFDRIAHMVAYICLLRLGAPRAPLTSTIDTIQNLRHSIRTAFGDSEQTYGGATDVPMQGLLQGNGVAPPGWSAVSAVLVQAMKDSGFGYSAWSAISRRAMEITCFAFVDDTDLIHAIDQDLPTEQLVDEAQKVLTLWEEMLRASGGALAPEKSFWYLIEVIREGGRWKYKQHGDSVKELCLIDTDAEGNLWESERLESGTSKEALGIFINPESTMKTQVKEMKAKVAKFCDSVRTGRLSRNDAWYVLNATIMKSLEYPLMATTLSQKELASIMSPLLRTTLPACGLQRLFPRKLLYGSLNAQGCDLKDPWIVQLIEHLLVILRHGEQDTPTGDLLRENIEMVQLYIGSKAPFWELPFEEAGFLAPDGWVKHTWEALSAYPVQLRGPMETIKHLRHNDKHIMDVARQCMGLNKGQLERINNFRLHIGATCVSDLSNAAGTKISDAAWNGTVPVFRKIQRRLWPTTYAPTSRDWTDWKTMLRLCFLAPHDNFRKLASPLGQWLNSHDEKWEWWLCPAEGRVWERREAGWYKWANTGISSDTNDMRFRATNEWSPVDVENLPRDAIRVDIRHIQNNHGIRVISRAQQRHIDQVEAPIGSFYEFLQRQPESAHWAIERVMTTDNASKIAKAIVAHSAVAVSDGSLKNQLGTAAFVIEADDSTDRINGVNKVPGPIKNGDSYRCELAGLYSIILTINCIAKYYHIPWGKCRIACDNESSLKVFAPDFFPDPKGDSFDLVTAVWSLLKESPIEWTPVHVRGHQDSKGKKLTRLERLNVQMDTAAKAYWQYLVLDEEEQMQPMPHDIYKEGWSLWTEGHKIVRPSRNSMYSILQDPTTIDWWVRHERISAVAVELIDWHANGKSLRKTPVGIRRWTTKHASHNCGCGTTLVEWNKQDDDRCPRCGECEDTDHVLRCNAEGADEEWATSMMTVESEMLKLETDPLIAQAIRAGMETWRKASVLDPSEYDDSMQEVVVQQTTIGWRNLIEGLWSKQWQHLQQRHYNRIESRKSGKQWVIKVSKVIKIAAFQQWKHRNDNKHHTKRPRHKEMERELNRQIAEELIHGPGNLPPEDHQHFNYNYVHLIRRPLHFKQAWIANVSTARLRYERKRHRDDEYENTSRKRSKILAWARSGRAT